MSYLWSRNQLSISSTFYLPDHHVYIMDCVTTILVSIISSSPMLRWSERSPAPYSACTLLNHALFIPTSRRTDQPPSNRHLPCLPYPESHPHKRSTTKHVTHRNLINVVGLVNKLSFLSVLWGIPSMLGRHTYDIGVWILMWDWMES